MNITLAENSGFCTGVKRADKFINSLIKENDGKIYTLGKLIHNRLYNENLASQGVVSVEFSELEEILENSENEKIKLVIRTHGIEKDKELHLKSLAEKHPNFKVYDMTCPYVKRIHEIARSKNSWFF